MIWLVYFPNVIKAFTRYKIFPKCDLKVIITFDWLKHVQLILNIKLAMIFQFQNCLLTILCSFPDCNEVREAFETTRDNYELTVSMVWLVPSPDVIKACMRVWNRRRHSEHTSVIYCREPIITHSIKLYERLEKNNFLPQPQFDIQLHPFLFLCNNIFYIHITQSVVKEKHFF